MRKKAKQFFHFNYGLIAAISLFKFRVYNWRFDGWHDLFFIYLIVSLMLVCSYNLFYKKEIDICIQDLLFITLLLGVSVTALTNNTILPSMDLVLLFAYGFLYSKTFDIRRTILITCLILNLVEIGALLLMPYAVRNNQLMGTFNNTAYLSGLLMVCIPVNIELGIYFYKTKKRIPSLILAVLSFINICIIILNQTRSCLLALAILGVYLLLKNMKSVYKYILFAFFIVIAVFFLSLFIKPDSANGRLLIWKVTSQNLSGIPFNGLGYGNYQNYYLNWQSKYFSGQQLYTKEAQLADSVAYAFNEYLQFYCEFGIFNLVLFLFLLTLALINKHRIVKYSTLKYALIVLLINCFFTYSLHCIPLLLLFISLLTMSLNQSYYQFKPNLIITRGAMIIIFFFLFIAIIFHVKNFKANKIWEQGYRLTLSSKPRDAMRYYVLAYPDLKTNGEFLYNYGTEALKLLDTSLSIKMHERCKQFLNVPEIYNQLGYCYLLRKDYALAEENLLYSIHAVPNRFIPRQVLLETYIAKGDTSKARETARQILQMPVKVRSSYTDLIRRKASQALNDFETR